MKQYYDWKIGTRILVGFLIVVVMSGIIGLFGVLGIRMVDNSYKIAYTDSTAALQYSEGISSSFQRIRMNLFAYVLAETTQDKDFFNQRMGNFKQVIDENIAAYRNMLSSYKAEEVEQEIARIDAIQTALINFGAKREELVQGIGMYPSRRSEAFEQLKDGGELRALALVVDDSITALIDYNIDYAADQIALNGRQTNISSISMIAVLGVGIVLAIILALFISRGISKKIAILVEASDNLALGDVNVHVEADSKDEIGLLMESFSKMIENTRRQAMVAEKLASGDMTVEVDVRSQQDLLGQKLRELVQKNNEVLLNIATASDQVSAGSDQVSAGAQALSQGATEQASSVEELTSTIMEVSGDLKNSAANAQEAKRLSDEAEREVVRSNRQMQDLMVAMEEITQTSQEIGKIIKTIDDIAFQTNILALNAAVEAARAGSAGQGFAVVADEVRNLAGKSAEAAKTTTDLIESTLSAIKKGRGLTEEAAHSLSQVAEKTKTVDGKMQEIAEDIERESYAVAQIATGIDQVSAVVQTNSATAEESAAASEELAGQATLLREQISKYKLKPQATQSFYQNLESHGLNSPAAEPYIDLSDEAYGRTASKGASKISLGSLDKY
jgi:methyl-accepting chemotaxis protein